MMEKVGWMMLKMKMHTVQLYILTCPEPLTWLACNRARRKSKQPTKCQERQSVLHKTTMLIRHISEPLKPRFLANRPIVLVRTGDSCWSSHM